MNIILNRYDEKEIAIAIDNEIRSLPIKNTPNLRAIRRKYSRMLKEANPNFILNLGREIFKKYGYRWIAYELIRYNEEAFKKIGKDEIIEFGVRICSWGAADSFAGLMSGPAWQKGQITDKLIHNWAHSIDRWWRRIALVSTVALNRKSLGGRGDIPRTLKVCRLLVNDKDDMVVKAMSWALRELIVHSADAVQEFICEYEDVIVPRVKREVKNKLTTGLKNPKRKDY